MAITVKWFISLKGDNPHELPQQQDLEGSTKIDHTLYSHADTKMPTPNSSQKL